MTTTAPSLPRLKVGLLGAGYILQAQAQAQAQAHAKALRTIGTVSLHTVCDPSEERAPRASAEYGIPNAATSVEHLLASGHNVV